MKKKIKPVPKFRNEQEEREFWTTHDTTPYFDFSESNRVDIEFDREIEAPVKYLASIATRDAQPTQGPGQQEGHSLSVAHQSLLGGKDRGRAESELDLMAYNARRSEHSGPVSILLRTVS